MTVTIKYLAQVKMAAGCAQERVELASPCTVVELVEQRARAGLPALQRVLLTNEGRLQPTILVFLNDRQSDHFSTGPVRDGDTVTVLAPMAGG